MSTEKKSREKIFSCHECGFAYVAYPPDDAQKRWL